MLGVIASLYFVFLFTCLLISLFVVMHITRSALSRFQSVFITTLFLVVLSGLVFSNVVLFLRIPFAEVIENVIPNISGI